MQIVDRLITWWIDRCPHDGGHIAADILEGGWDNGRVSYCRRCGSYRIHYDTKPFSITEWRKPRPLWFKAEGPAGIESKSKSE